MNAHAVRTDVIMDGSSELSQIIERHLDRCPERSVLAITSKIVALCQGRTADPGKVDRDQLIEQEASHYLPTQANAYHVALTIKEGRLIPTAGIDRSNADGNFVLWPQDPQQVANETRKFLCSHFGRRFVGVIITDSASAPLRRGVVGICLAHSGFRALNSYVGMPDLFGRELRTTRTNVGEALAATAVLLMGEGAEQTPMAQIGEIPSVEFQDRDPNPSELAELRMSVQDDLYRSLLEGAPWKPGRGR
ncbi:MAG: coenzyme F420-0:L-glutamate ligase [Candidatus Dormibacteraceae bacterium]